jgi:hypothetical protein
VGQEGALEEHLFVASVQARDQGSYCVAGFPKGENNEDTRAENEIANESIPAHKRY